MGGSGSGSRFLETHHLVNTILSMLIEISSIRQLIGGHDGQNNSNILFFKFGTSTFIQF